MVAEQEHDEATERGETRLKTEPRAISVRFDKASGVIVVELNWGYSIVFRPERAQELHSASTEDLSEVEITYPGMGIYFPRIDADLLVSSMTKGRFGNDRWEEAWAAAHSQDKAA